MSGSIVLTEEESPGPYCRRQYQKYHFLRGASKDPQENTECSDIKQLNSFLLAACEDDSEAWGGKKEGGLLVNVLLECIEKAYFTGFTLRNLLFQTHHLLQRKAIRVLKARPGIKIQQLRVHQEGGQML
ncbi:hypothetical protein M422DRAFT_271582 [Sphaerobolus stellatus SS14]|uniref:Uncharacterized protein n=1 Tax=Sphaerobolus stellatus (strain SS14) TaxID=990650 RepID=A0A0C9UPI6_SPHS4|nr:hypothetical protein M422DRAFT_271582 [Sphaerobolus stellatus SS14]